MKLQKAFSMIELIFAIVIIAILASFALPSLMATRDDASSAIIKRDITSSLEAITAYYYSRGNLKDNNGNASLANAIKLDSTWSLVSNSSNEDSLAYLYNTSSINCVVIEFIDNKIRVLIANENSNHSTSCTSIRTIYNIDTNKAISLNYNFNKLSDKLDFIEIISKDLSTSGIKW